MAKKGEQNGLNCVICGEPLTGRQKLYDKAECKRIGFERKHNQTVQEPSEPLTEPSETVQEPQSEVLSVELVETRSKLTKVSAQLEAVQVVVTQSAQERDRAIAERDTALNRVSELERENGVLEGKLGALSEQIDSSAEPSTRSNLPIWIAIVALVLFLVWLGLQLG